MADVAPALEQGRYRLVALLGEGGMAVVYRSWDTRLKVWRAVKVLAPDAARRPALRERFEAEAQTMARLRHRHILAVHDVGHTGDRPYMVMDLVLGGCLVDWIGKYGPMPPRLAARVMEDVLAGLQFAHENGVVHRDVKPHNVLLEADGTPLVADFGIARIDDAAGSGSKTRTGVMMGTLAYMAPEQRTSARRVDARADVYAAAGTLLALLTAQEPYDLYVTKELDRQLTNVPLALAAIIRKGGSYDPADRHGSAAEMAQALAAVRDELPVLAPDTPPLVMLGTKTLPPPPAADDPAPAAVPAGATYSGDLGGVTVDTLAEPRTLSTDPGLRPVPITAPTSISEPPAETPRPLSARAPTGSTEGGGRGGLFVGMGLGVVALAVLTLGVALTGIGITLYATSGSGSGTATAATAAPPVVAPPAAPVAIVPVEAPPIVEAPPAVEAPPVVESPHEPPVATPPVTRPSVKPALVTRPVEVAAVAEAPPTAAKGTLRVNAMPPGTLTLDGASIGTTPWSSEVAVGPHKVEIAGDDGTKYVVDVVVDPEEVEKLCWDFALRAPCARR